MLKISILTIGDEICIGQITNTNASFIANQCTRVGADVIAHSSVGDEKSIIVKELTRLSELSDIIIITGGLGPTKDDITKSVLAEFFSSPLVFHSDTFNKLEKYLEARNIKITDRNRKIALLPKGCTVLPNNVGTAPGMLLEKDGKYFISLPGVPYEMKQIMTDSVIPFIKQQIEIKNHDVRLYKTILTTNIPESLLAELLGENDDIYNNASLAYLPSPKGVRLRIGVSAKSFIDAEIKIKNIFNHILEKAGKYVYGEEDESIAKLVGKMLTSKNQTLAVAESCTGGMLGSELTDVSGSSNYFLGGIISYSNDIKIKLLNVNPSTIENFGAVSEQTAKEMASSIVKITGADYGISITGIAGPTGGTEQKPVGTVYIGLADKNSVTAKKFIISNDRRMNRERAVAIALNMLYDRLKQS